MCNLYSHRTSANALNDAFAGLTVAPSVGNLAPGRVYPDQQAPVIRHKASRSMRLAPMTADTFDLVEAARRCALAGWPKQNAQRYGFTKAGVLLDDLVRTEDRPRTLFDGPRPKSQAVMAALDEINTRFGRKAMVLASEGMTSAWGLRANHRSPRYTTRLKELPVVR